MLPGSSALEVIGIVPTERPHKENKKTSGNQPEVRLPLLVKPSIVAVCARLFYINPVIACNVVERV